MDTVQRRKIADLFAKENVLVISTQGDAWPTATMQAFAETLEFDIVLIMLDSSVKFQNLLQRPNVALVIDDRDKGDIPTLQVTRVSIRGRAREVERKGAEWKDLQALFLKKNPFEEPFFSYDTLRMVRISPVQISYANGTSEHFTVDF